LQELVRGLGKSKLQPMRLLGGLRSAVAWSVTACVLTAGCASYSARRVASDAVHVAVFRYQHDEQAHGTFTSVWFDIEEPPHSYAPKATVIRELAKLGIHGSPYVSMHELPTDPPEQQLFLEVYARPERDYADQVVILGGFNTGDGTQGGSYRYFVEPHEGVWQVVKIEAVDFETDCYGNLWFTCSSRYPY
jgi:hypothetical protein